LFVYDYYNLSPQAIVLAIWVTFRQLSFVFSERQPNFNIFTLFSVIPPALAPHPVWYEDPEFWTKKKISAFTGLTISLFIDYL
jgi:hypothetical protein